MSPATRWTTPLVPASSANLTIHAQRRIAAPAALVFGVIRNTETWKDWNDFTPRVTIRSQLEDGAAGGEDGHGTTSPGSPHHDRAAGAPATSTQDHPQRTPSTKHKAVTGDPSVRLKIGTTMTFHVRMDPEKPDNYRDYNLLVTEVSRPTDVLHDLAKSKTHTVPLEKTDPLYRISWASDPALGFPATFPKWMLLVQRVYEVQPIVLADGSEECEVTTWECQGGLAARIVKAMYEKYLQKVFQDGLKTLGDFCEAMGGKVDRRDFSIDHDALRRGTSLKADV